MRKLIRTGVASVAVLTLTGCSTGGAETASVVDGTRITQAQVNALSSARCAASDNLKGAPPIARERVQTQSLGFLIDVELNQKFGRSKGLKPRPQNAKAFLTEPEKFAALIPASKRQVFLDDFTRWAEGLDLLIQVGEKQTGQQLSFANGNDLALVGLAARKKWERGVKVETNDSYNPDKYGQPREGGGSVSEAASRYARDGSSSKPSKSWAEGLPRSQRCG